MTRHPRRPALMKYCCHCGSPVRFDIPPEDDRPRFICDRCATVHYHNPHLIVGTLPVWEEKVLLCRRAIEPRRGFWTLPSGFMENGETVEEGAIRETVEEAGADITVLRLFSVFSLPHINQVYLLFLARLNRPDFAPGRETEETRLFSVPEIPWDALAFRAVEFALRRYAEGNPGVRVFSGSYLRSASDPWVLAQSAPEDETAAPPR